MTKLLSRNQNNGASRPVSTVVASRPGVMRQSLKAFLNSHGRLTIVAIAGDGLTALNYVLRYGPELLVIDSNLLDDEAEALLGAVKAKSPQTRCLICVQSSQPEARLLASGADAVIHRDSPPQQVQEILLRLTQRAAW